MKRGNDPTSTARTVPGAAPSTRQHFRHKGAFLEPGACLEPSARTCFQCFCAYYYFFPLNKAKTTQLLMSGFLKEGNFVTLPHFKKRVRGNAKPHNFVTFFG